MAGTIGWDIGGAHLKGARVEDGEVVAVAQIACPLWLGIDQLHQAFAQAKPILGAAGRHAVTMTGELSDAFPNRAAGVAAISKAATQELGSSLQVYAGPDGFVPADASVDYIELIASANWHASASLVARQEREALFIDIGSTTTDIVPIKDGAVAASGYSDATRMAHGELVYAGVVRSFLAPASRLVPFGGRWVPLMNEAFATMSDVYRILGELPEDADLMPAADNGSKTVEASRVRLARQIGIDARDVSAQALDGLAAYFAEIQAREVCDGIFLAQSNVTIAAAAPIVGAGAGRFVIKKLAERLTRPYADVADRLPAHPDVLRKAADCLPACAVGLLASLSLRDA